MASPQRRPRDKGGTEHKNLTAKAFESSNSTMTKFLGGTPKSWMTGHYVVKDKPMSTSNVRPPSTVARRNSSNRRKENPLSVQPESVRPQYQADHNLNTTHDPGTANTIDTPSAIAIPRQQNIDTIRPPSTPNDEHRQEIVHIIDLEEEEHQPNTVNQQQNPPINHTGENRMNDQAEKHMSIEGFQDTQTRKDITSAADGHLTLPLHIEDSRAGIVKRNLQYQNDSRKRAQISGLSASERIRCGPLPESHHLDEGLLPSPTARVPSEATMRAFLGQIIDRLDTINGAQDRRGKAIEISRLGLLQDACNRRDYFYIMIHQLFCLSSTLTMPNQSSINSLTSEHLSGLMLLSDLLLSNDQMENQAVLWFSTFPLTLEALLRNWPGLKPSYDKTLGCLSKLPHNWIQLRNKCHQRLFPPLIDEMRGGLGAASFVLQRVMSTAIWRDIWKGPQDECYLEGERLFHRNHQAVQLRDSQEVEGQAMNEANMVSYNKQLASEYHRLWLRHQRHIPAFVTSPLNPQSPITFLNTPPLPSSSFSNTPINAVTQAELPTSQYVSPNYIQLSAPPQQHRPRGRPRRDQAPQMIPGNNDLGFSTPDQTSVHNSLRQGNAQPQNATTNTSPQLPANTWNEQPIEGVRYAQFRYPMQSFTGMPATPPYFNNSRAYLSHQNIPQNRSATFPLQRQGQFPVPSVPSSPQFSSGPYSRQLGTYQVHSQRTNGQHIQPSRFPQFLPLSGQIRSHTEPPNPISSALHQVQARSPLLTLTDMSGKKDSTIQSFAFVRRLAVIPNRLDAERRHFKWSFEITKEDYDILAKDLEVNDGAPPTRLVRNGSCLSRIRCVKAIGTDEITEGDWVVADTVWPNGVAMLINGTALEIRKKVHHGKDLPVDVTKYIKEGENVLSVATTRPKQNDQTTYATALETIQIADYSTVKNGITKLGSTDALKRILKRSGNADPDVQIVDNAIIIDLTDPYTSRIFEKPVRGQACRHNQCFDLEVFLQTRSRKNPSHPSLPDHFRCPICMADARPQCLIMDLFFESVRNELVVMNRLDVKAIVLDEHGNWKIKEEEQAGESRDDPEKSPSRVDEAAHSPARKPPERRDSEVIELDD